MPVQQALGTAVLFVLWQVICLVLKLCPNRAKHPFSESVKTDARI